MIGLVKRMIAALHGVDVDNPNKHYAWLALKKGGHYSKVGGKPTRESRAKSFRIQRASARKRELLKGVPRFIKLKTDLKAARRKKFEADIRSKRHQTFMKKRLSKINKTLS